MPVWIALLLGAVQGLAEFLPISSSGHLVLMQSLLDFEQYGADAVAFDLVLHLGTLAAVVIAFWRDVRELVVEGIKWIIDGFRLRKRPYRRLVMMILLATVPLVIGAFAEKLLSAAFETPLVVGIGLCITAVVLWTANAHVSGRKTEADAPLSDGLKVGLWQLVALIPGISRSGSTICGGLFCGFERNFAVRFAFLMSIPAVLGAAVFKLPDIAGGLDGQLLPYLAGFAAAAVFGYCAIALVRTLMKRNSFRWFSVYCLAVGLAAIVFSLI